MDEKYSTFETIQESLKEKHYVRFRIFPQSYDQNRATSFRDLVDAVSACRVSIRGWDMPHFDSKAVSPSTDFVGAGFNKGRYVEAWRAYKSYQFEFLEQCSEEEDSWQIKLRNNDYEDGEAAFFLSWINVIYSFCEYFEFAKRYAVLNKLTEGVFIEITYHNMVSVGLSTDSFERHTGRYEPLLDSEILIKRQLSLEELVSGSGRLAREALMDFFHYFRWNVRSDIVRQVQSEFFDLGVGRDTPTPNLD